MASVRKDTVKLAVTDKLHCDSIVTNKLHCSPRGRYGKIELQVDTSLADTRFANMQHHLFQIDGLHSFVGFVAVIFSHVCHPEVFRQEPSCFPLSPVSNCCIRANLANCRAAIQIC